MSLSVDRYELGPVGTNCYVVRQEPGAPLAVVVDPGADASELPAECAGILITHSHWDHLGGVADLAERTGAKVYMPRQEAPVLAHPSDWFPEVPLRPYEADVLLDGDETLELAGLSFETVNVPGHSPGHVAFYTRGRALLGRRPLRGVGRQNRPSVQRLGHALRVDPRADGALSAGDGRLSRPRPRDDARRRARPQPVPRRAARLVKFESPRGTHDVLPAEQPLWERVIREAEAVCTLYGYRRITTPLFEDTGLFARTSGEGSDIVQKEMYTFTDRGDRSLTLRPEGTASVARAYIQHGLHREPQPVKTFFIGPMYRYAAPQKGKFREFWQLNVEAMGSDDAAVDAEVIQLYAESLRRLEIRGWWLELNSIGDRNCRPAYLEKLTAWLDEHAHELDEDTRAKRETSPLRVFDNLSQKPESVQQALARAPKIGESLCEECQAHFDAVRRYLDAYGVEYRLTPTLVRGLDYYTRTTFEFMGEALGAQSSLCGGGRYDYLIEEIGGPPTPAVGLASGIERIVLSLVEQGAEVESPEVEVFFAVEDDDVRPEVLAAMADLRRAGRASETDYAGRSLKGQLTQAGRVGARATVIARTDGATVRRVGEKDVDFPALDDAVKSL